MTEMPFLLPMVLALGIVFILPITSKKLRARLIRDRVELIMFGVAAMLTFALMVFAGIAVRTHHVEILEIPVLAIGAFAIVGIVFGLFRSLRSAAKRPVR
ncbi:MAG: hypothetical protein JSR81_02370 [Proteobacteria bacterium]|nr:hypothetical protein [Pseudomonadota bacterium]